MRLTFLLACGLVLGALPACSPYSFSKETAALSDGVDKLSDAFASGYDGLAADRAAKAQIDMIDSRAGVLVAPSCETSRVKSDGSTLPCGLYMRGTKPPELTSAEKTRPETLKAVKKLRDYAKALAAVTNAADRAAYDAAVAQLSGAVGALATPADAVAPGLSTLAPAAVNVVGWLFGTALDQQRYDSLRRAVTAVGLAVATEENPDPDSHIRVVARTLGQGLYMLKLARLEALGAEVDSLVDGLNTRTWTADAYRKRLGDAQVALGVVDALRKSDPRGAANDLAEAHDKLVLVVTDASKNYTSLMKALGDFVDKVTAVHAALTAMSTPPTAKKGT